MYLYVENEEIVTTPEHPFWVVYSEWCIAIEIRAGDILKLSDGSTAVVTATRYERLDTPIKVYNFEVEDFHTYYVGNSSVLVHNKCESRGKLSRNMLKEGPAPGDGYQAHHGLPWARKNYFEEAGLDINEARFGRWVKGGGNGNHQSWSKRYDTLWTKYIDCHKDPVAADIIDYFNKLNGIR